MLGGRGCWEEEAGVAPWWAVRPQGAWIPVSGHGNDGGAAGRRPEPFDRLRASGWDGAIQRFLADESVDELVLDAAVLDHALAQASFVDEPRLLEYAD